MINYLKPKKEIDYILLLFKFGERITNSIKNYLKLLAKLFTPNEFFCHLSIIFTHFPCHSKKKNNRNKERYIKEINIILRNIFNLTLEEQLPSTSIYFINTEFDEDEGEYYDKKSQDTIDIIIKQIKLNSKMYKSINTENLELNGVDKRISQEKKILMENTKKLEELIRKKEMENIYKKENEKKILEERKKAIEAERKILEEKEKAIEAERKKLEEKEKAIEAQRKKLEEERNRKGNLSILGNIISSFFS